MTLVAAWVRNIGKTEELVLATDSRLQGGKETRESGGGVSSWSECKLLPERSRCVPVSNQQGHGRRGEGSNHR